MPRSRTEMIPLMTGVQTQSSRSTIPTFTSAPWHKLLTPADPQCLSQRLTSFHSQKTTMTLFGISALLMDSLGKGCELTRNNSWLPKDCPHLDTFHCRAVWGGPAMGSTLGADADSPAAGSCHVYYAWQKELR